MAKGIRSYGPGKFHTILDSYVHTLTLDGGADEEASYPQEGSGWYGLVWLDDATRDNVEAVAKDENDQRTDAELDLLEDSVAVILFERSDGIVEADWFDSKRDAEEAWEDILIDTDEGDDDEEEAD